MTPVSRRSLLCGAVAAGLLPQHVRAGAAASMVAQRRTRFAVSTYSFWQFKNKDLRSIETCIDLAAEWGFDGVENS